MAESPAPAGVPELLVSVDVEASGPSPSTGSLVAVGACLVADPRVAFYREIRPLPGRPWDLGTERIHRLSRRHLAAHGAEPRAAMIEWAEWLDDVGDGARPIFVGFNAAFDWMFVADYFHRFLGRNPFGISALDLKAVYMGRYAVARWSDTRRHVLVDRFPALAGVNHHALDDARAQAEIARELLGLSPPSAPPGR